MSGARIVVIGAGMGGLTAALRLQRRGFQVHLLEARSGAGGLASGLEAGGLSFDGGPYVVLDRPGLEWAFAAAGAGELLPELVRVSDVYQVSSPDAPSVRIRASIEETAAGLDRDWPGAGERYRTFVAQAGRIYRALQPLLVASRPALRALFHPPAWPAAPFLLRSLATVLAQSGLPGPVQAALGIWTHVAGQSLAEAPSALSFVPWLIHQEGAFQPRGGMRALPDALSEAAAAAGVRFEYGTRVRSIRTRHGRVVGVVTDRDDLVAADAVVSNAAGLATCLELVRETPASERARLARLPLQSPGVCAYLALTGPPNPPFLRFHLPGGAQRCRLFIQPAVVDPALGSSGISPARLLMPMDHARAEAAGPAGQEAALEAILAEQWWRDGTHVSVLHRRTPAEWGQEFGLYRAAMNPVMTARLMRRGRLPHRNPHVRGLYLAGSATHPGQWVSFCAISGILAARCVEADLS